MIKQFSFISIFLLLIAFFDLPYGFYQFLRIFLFISSIYYLFQLKSNSYYYWGWLMISIIYNPILPIFFKRSVWQNINFISIIFILLWILCIKNLTDKNL